ncbi:MAG: 3-deoxy-D-manno-octulosonic-acid transferase [Gammaproteobacteria bacterium]|nr:3-deoxy-D-manno-octulosonic-acid transferase [Gammaproteobacteria bacterium]
MRLLYSVLVYLFRPIAIAVVLWRGLRNPRYRAGFTERFGFGKFVDSPTLWVHAVSLGEVTAAAALIRALRARHPRTPVVLTTATPTGRARANSLFGDSVDVRFLPYDTPGSVRRFVRRVRPRLAIIMETELWPNLFNECRRRGVPVVWASARLSPKSVTWYRRLGGLFRNVLSGNTVVAAQSAEDAERFIAVGAARDRTHVVGNVKFDMAIDAARIERGLELRSGHWGSRPVWIAGSTHAGEEEMVLTAHAALQAAAAGALLVLVPRHPERFQAVADLLGRRGFRFDRRSSGNAARPDSQVVLVDTVGELADLYAAADVAFVGGSLVPVGGHNLLEPAALGVPVITGPFQSNGREIAQLLLREGAALQVDDAEELADALKQLFADPARRERMGASGRRVVDANRGSLERLLELIDPVLRAEPIP